VSRPLPLWAAAILPATLIGHGIAYAAQGRSLADGHHGWIAPVFEWSLALLIALCTMLLGDTLMRAHVLAQSAAESSVLAVWPRLALSQIGLFMMMERAEGTHAGLLGCFVQIVVAFATAYVICLFARLLARCRKGSAVNRYIRRLLSIAPSFAVVEPAYVAHALAVRAGASRFQRPPPKL